MDTFTTVTFDREEREVFGRANVHLTLAFPGAGQPQQRGSKDDSPDIRARIVYQLGVDRKIGDLQTLERCRDVYAALLAKAEDDLARWSGERDRVKALIDSGTPAPTGGGVPIIADPVQAADVLVEARTMQIKHARAALELIEQALQQIPQREVVAAWAAAAEAGV